MKAFIAVQLLGLLAARAGAETHATPATFLHPLVETSNRSAPLLVPLARRPRRGAGEEKKESLQVRRMQWKC